MKELLLWSSSYFLEKEKSFILCHCVSIYVGAQFTTMGVLASNVCPCSLDVESVDNMCDRLHASVYLHA